MSLPSSSLHAEIRDVLVCRTEEGRDDEVGTALSYGLSLAAATGAHLTVQSSAQRLTVVAGAAWGIVSGLVAGENLRRRGLARSIAECAATDAATAGVICTTEVPMLAYPDLLARLVGRARLADLTILDAESKEIDLDPRFDRRYPVQKWEATSGGSAGLRGVLCAADPRCLGWQRPGRPGGE